jgi:hypothetical protein
VSITPFLLNYQGAPFDHFSWKKMNSSEFFPQYYQYQQLDKTKGAPNQKESFTLKALLIPEKLVMNSTYSFEQEITNTGQGIVNPKEGYELIIKNIPAGASYIADPLPYIEPTEKGIIRVQIKTPTQEGKMPITVGMKHNQKFILLEEKNVMLVPPPTITLSAQLGWKKTNEAKNTTILIYDEQDQLLHKFQNLTITNGMTSITGLYNMIPEKTYRIVLIVPFYLPRQQLMTLNSEGTSVTMKRLYPLDFNKDGTFNLLDIPSLFFTKPHDVFSRFF